MKDRSVLVLDASLYYVSLLGMIGCSAFFSASETAFSSVNLIRLRQYAEAKRSGAKKALYVAERFDEVLLAILIGNNIVNLSSAAIATVVATEVLGFGSSGVALATAVMTILIIIFGEILPKSYAKQNSELLSLRIGGFYYYLLIIFKPLIQFFIWIKKGLSIFQRSSTIEPSVTEDELNVIIDTMEEEGVLHQDEVDMLQGVLDLSATQVRQIMTPRVDLVSVDIEESITTIKNIFLTEKYSRIPVYQGSPDHIIGILYERELLAALIDDPQLTSSALASLVRPPMFVSYRMKVSDLLTRLQRGKQHLAIVADEYGGTAGIVTLEDVLEEVVGEIYDEYDEESDTHDLLKRSEGLYEAKGTISLKELFEVLDDELDVPEDASSLESWLYAKIEDIPNYGDVYLYQGWMFTLLQVDERRIQRVQVEAFKSEETKETESD